MDGFGGDAEGDGSVWDAEVGGAEDAFGGHFGGGRLDGWWLVWITMGRIMYLDASEGSVAWLVL